VQRVKRNAIPKTFRYFYFNAALEHFKIGGENLCWETIIGFSESS
jgi:hypothetical protein